MAKYLVTEEKGLGYFNMIIWDVLFILFFVTVALPHTIHTVFRILIAIATSILLLVLIRIPILGKLLQVGLGLFLAYILWSILQVPTWSFVEGDMIWTWTLRILFALVFIGIHVISSNELGLMPEDYSIDFSCFLDFIERMKSRKANTTNYKSNLRDEEDIFDDCSEDWNQSENKQYQEQRSHSFSTNQQQKGFNPFAGCNDEESLTRRYRSLLKNFHPDMSNGDKESTQMLIDEYEKLLKTYRCKN